MAHKCEALTFYIQRPFSDVWGQENSVCEHFFPFFFFMCVCMLQGWGFGVTVQFSKTPPGAHKTGKKQNQGDKCHLSIFTSLFYIFCQNRRAEDVNNIDNCSVDRFTREKCKRRGRQLHILSRRITALSYLQYTEAENVMERCVCKEDTVALAYCFSSLWCIAEQLKSHQQTPN